MDFSQFITTPKTKLKVFPYYECVYIYYKLDA